MQNVIIQFQCSRCGKMTEGKCALRKALDMIPNNTPDAPDGRCPYYSVI